MAKSSGFLKTRKGLVVSGLLAFVVGWFMFLKAVDTGSLQQYGLLIVLIVFGVNRLLKALFPTKK